jgi:hypothetical protein
MGAAKMRRKWVLTNPLLTKERIAHEFDCVQEPAPTKGSAMKNTSRKCLVMGVLLLSIALRVGGEFVNTQKFWCRRAGYDCSCTICLFSKSI